MRWMFALALSLLWCVAIPRLLLASEKTAKGPAKNTGNEKSANRDISEEQLRKSAERDDKRTFSQVYGKSIHCTPSPTTHPADSEALTGFDWLIENFKSLLTGIPISSTAALAAQGAL